MYNVYPRLGEILKERKMTQVQLAELTGIPQGTISKFDKNKQHQDAHLIAISRALNIAVEDLFIVEKAEVSNVSENRLSGMFEIKEDKVETAIPPDDPEPVTLQQLGIEIKMGTGKTSVSKNFMQAGTLFVINDTGELEPLSNDSIVVKNK